MSARIAAARSRLFHLDREEQPAGPFGDAAMGAVARVVGHDGYCLFVVDPLSGVRTTMFSRHGLTCGSPRLLENETVDDDLNRYCTLVDSGRYSGVLARSRGPEPMSPRLHEILRPDGYCSELRLVLVDGGRYWGGLSLFRDDPRRPFGEGDEDAIRALRVPLAHAVRRDQLTTLHPPDLARPAGVALVDRQGQVQLSPEARSWLELLEDPGEHGVVVVDLFRMVLELADSARSLAAGRPAPGSLMQPVARMRAASGEWLVASLSRLQDNEMAVVLRPGDTRTVAPAFALWAGLTARETDVLQMLLQGLTSRLVARALKLSPLTIGDHLRSIYRKVGVNSRDELLALLR